MMDSLDISRIYNGTLAVVLVFIGVPANCLIVVTYGRKSVSKDSTVIVLLALAVADLIPCLVTSPIEAAMHLLNLNSNSTLPSCQVTLEQYCYIHQSVFVATESFSTLLNNLLAINCCYATWRTKGESRLCTNFRGVIAALIVVFFIFSVAIGVLTGVTLSLEEKFAETIAGHTIYFILGSSLGCSLIIILTANILTIRNIIKQQNQSKKFARELQKKIQQLQSRENNIDMDEENDMEMIKSEGQKSLMDKSKRMHNKTQIQVIKRLLATTFIFFFSYFTSFTLLLVKNYKFGDRHSMNKLENEHFTAFIFFVIFKELWRYNHLVNAFLYGFMSTKFKREFNKMETNILQCFNTTRLNNSRISNGTTEILNDDPIQLSTVCELAIASNEGEAETVLNETFSPNTSTNLGHSLPSLSSCSGDAENLTNNVFIITADVHAAAAY